MPEVTTAYKFRIYPTDDQQALLARYFGHARFVWNYFLRLRSSVYKSDGISIPRYQTNRLLTQRQKLPKYAFLNDIPTQPTHEAAINLDKAFTVFFAGV